MGGKGKLLWLIDRLAPASYARFVDVFGGSGTVTLGHPLRRGCAEVYNDFNSNLIMANSVNMGHTARSQKLPPEKLIKFLIAAEGGPLAKELHRAGIDAAPAAVSQRRRQIPPAVFWPVTVPRLIWSVTPARPALSATTARRRGTINYI